jgi:Competence protein
MCKSFEGPQWVLVEGQLHHVSEYASLEIGRRPSAYCPTCNTRVILKLGPKVIHHFAHHSGVVCAEGQPENATRFNALYHLVAQLRAGKTLTVHTHCPQCGTPFYRDWPGRYDQVSVASLRGSGAPDILISYKHEVVGGLELDSGAASHEVEASPEREYAVARVPVTSDFYSGAKAWKPGIPLEVIFDQALRAPLCGRCTTKQAQRQSYLAQKKSRPSDQDTHIFESSLVDFYYATGKKFRALLLIRSRILDGKDAAAWLEENGKKLLELQSPLPGDWRERLHQAAAEKQERAKATGALIYVQSPWTLWEKGARLFSGDFERFPFVYAWDSEHSAWRERLPDRA